MSRGLLRDDGQGDFDVDLDRVLEIAAVDLDPRDLIAEVDFFSRQSWFDRLKAEAKRLGVEVDK